MGPPVTDAGLNDNELSLGAVIERVAFAELDPKTPLIVAEVVVDTDEVETVNDVDVAPAGTTMLPGTVAAELELVRVMLAPELPAFAEIVTFPVAFEPPDTELGVTVNDLRVCADTDTQGITARSPKTRSF